MGYSQQGSTDSDTTEQLYNNMVPETDSDAWNSAFPLFWVIGTYEYMYLS